MMSHCTIDFEFRQCCRKMGILTLLWVCTLSLPIRVDAQTERKLPRMSAQHISEEIKVDGVLDEPIWQSVEPVSYTHLTLPTKRIV